jgi:hypothetical protein
VIRPIGTSPGLARTAPGGNFPGNDWPPAGVAATSAGWQPALFEQFPLGAWGGYYLSVAALGAFVQANAADPVTGANFTWSEIDIGGPIGAADRNAELAELFDLIDYRPRVMAEAMAQRSGIEVYWRGILNFNPASHPWTCDLMQIALHVGEFQAMHYKYQFDRPRPSQISPLLMPPVEIPGHASYPSGHATESWLLSGLLAEVMPAQAAVPLALVAERVARNREVLGLHYPSDSAAGKFLAASSKLLLMQCDLVQTLIAKARDEWTLNRSV